MGRRLAALAGAALLGVVLPPRALPARGVAVDLGRIDVRQKLTPGGGYDLPVFHVSNPGSVATTYRLSVSYVNGQHGKRPPESWFRLRPAALTLEPGGAGAVRARISLPTGADPGSYEALLTAEIGSAGRAGAHVGAAAGVRVSFTVEPATFLGAVWERVKTLLGRAEPWSWLVPSLLAGGLALGLAARRFSIRVERR